MEKMQVIGVIADCRRQKHLSSHSSLATLLLAAVLKFLKIHDISICYPDGFSLKIY